MQLDEPLQIIIIPFFRSLGITVIGGYLEECPGSVTVGARPLCVGCASYAFAHLLASGRPR